MLLCIFSVLTILYYIERRLISKGNDVEAMLWGKGMVPTSRFGRTRKPNTKYVAAAKGNLTIPQAREQYGYDLTRDAVMKEVVTNMDVKDVFDFLWREEFDRLMKVGAIASILPSKFFLTGKFDASGEFDKLKARLAACGNFQSVYDITDKETESPTVSITTVLILLSIAAKMKLHKRAFDVSAAYLNAELDKPEYMRISKDIAAIIAENDPEKAKCLLKDGSMVVRLKKALYGLRQASKKWYDLLKSVLEEAGYKKSAIDPCLFTKQGEVEGEVTYVLVYVDDLLVLGTSEELCMQLKEVLVNKFKDITDKGADKLSYLGLEIVTDIHGNIKLSQKGYIMKLLEDYGIVSDSMYPSDDKILNDEAKDIMDDLCDKGEYLTLLMKIMFLAIRTRCDIIYATSVLASRNVNPTNKDNNRLFKILEYLHRTPDHGIMFKSEGEIYVNSYVDASFNSHWDARGHQGFVIFPDLVGSGAIFIKSAKQKHVADSSAEAELMALHECVKHLMYVISIYEELGFVQRGVPVYQDNQAVIKISSTEPTVFKGRSKLINRKYFSVHEYVTSGEIKLVYVGTDSNVADFLTKALMGDKFRRFRIDIMGTGDDICRGDSHSDNIEY